MFFPLLDALSKMFPFKANPVLSGEDAENFLEKVERGRLQKNGPVPTPNLREAIRHFCDEQQYNPDDKLGPVPTPKLRAALERFRREHEIDFDEHICSPCNYAAISGGRDVCGYYLIGGDTIYITKEMRKNCVLREKFALHVFKHTHGAAKKPLPAWYRRYFDFMERRK